MLTRELASASAKQSARAVRIQAATAPPSTASRPVNMPRRQLLGVAGLSLVALVQTDSPAFASFSKTSSLCTYAGSDEAGDDCRAEVLKGGSTEVYSDVSMRKSTTVVTGVPVAVLDETYKVQTLVMLGDIETYVNADAYDKARIPLIKKVKAQCIEWVSKYARGGSARGDSARRTYIAVDATIGFMASNGLAPFPKAKAKTITATIEEARNFLASGK